MVLIVDEAMSHLVGNVDLLCVSKSYSLWYASGRSQKLIALLSLFCFETVATTSCSSLFDLSFAFIVICLLMNDGSLPWL